jgi:predicted PurR-regulated permease PerM
MVSGFAAHSEGKQALIQQDDRKELPSLSPSGWSAAGIIIAVLLVFYTLFLTASLLIPIAAAVLLSMLLAPAVQFLERLYVPRLLASAIVVLSIMGVFGVGV